MRATEIILKRNTDLYNRYIQMYFKEMLREEIIFEKLKEEFYLEVDTIYRIVLKCSREEPKAETEQLI